MWAPGILGSFSAPTVRRADVRAGGLASVFEPGAILQDRNGDEQVDFVSVRIILPDEPSPGEVAAAAAVGARLGLETSGMSLPLVFRASDVAADEAVAVGSNGLAEQAGATPVIVIGATNPHLPPAVAARAAALEAGQGLASFERGLVAIAGRDADGTQAAGEAFAARSPYLWNVIGRAEGDTFERVAGEVAAALEAGGVEVAEVTFDELVYDKDLSEVVRASVGVSVPAGRAAEARDVLANIAEGHRRGRATDVLNYASVSEVVYGVTDGGDRFAVPMPRVGLPSRYLNPPRREPTRFEGQRDTGREGRGAAAGRGGGAAGGRGQARSRTFDLSEIFVTDDGLFDDEDSDGIADDSHMMIVFPGKAGRDGDYPSVGTAHLAARLGLESTGLSLPLLGFDTELEKPEEESRPLVLVGRENRLVQALAAIGKIRDPDGRPGVGRVEMVPDAYHDNSAVVVTGADVDGEEAAAAYLARRAPYLWAIGRGEPTLDDAKQIVRKALGGRTTAAQAALAVKELEDVLEDLEDTPLESIAIDAYFEDAVPAFDDWVRTLVRRRLGLSDTPAEGEPTIEVVSHERMAPVQVFDETPELDWEVDAFWESFRESVVPKIGRGDEVSLEVRVSEAPELREELAGRIRAEIEQAGGRPGQIRVLSAYKQGLSWLTDEVAPALAGRSLARLEIGWRPFAVELKTEQRFQNEPARWLNELYPADDVLARELGLPLDAISFYIMDPDPGPPDEEAAAAREPARRTTTPTATGTAAPPAGGRGQGEAGSRRAQEETPKEHVAVSPYRDRPIYTVTATDAAGTVILRDDFSPAVYERPYFDAFADYATVTVATGWLRAEVAGQVVVDERIATDSDLIWDHYQATTLKAVYDHVRQTTGNRPTRDKAPYFHTLRVEIEASEPDYQIGIDQEHISVLESLHDDVYFDTLDFFNQVAEVAAGGEAPPGRALAAGNVLPWILPERRGQAPRVSITYSAFASKDPKIVVKYRERGSDDEEPTTVTRTLAPVQVPEPYVYLAEATAGADGLSRLGLLVTVPDTDPLPRLATLLDNLSRLQGDGLFSDAFPLAGVRNVSIRLEAPGAVSTRTYRASVRERERTPPVPYAGGPLVTWDHVISPEESEQIAHTLGTLPNVTTYVGGYSYQGRPVSVMEIRLPIEAELVSQAKLNVWKPVLSIVGRQHANEVSSTSHILRLAELLATDPQYERYLHKMNVVIQPVVNPDGAALAYELQKLTPTHCLHAGRYSALGPDVPGQATVENTLLTEALVMRDVSRRWVPDVSLNPHGYPSHEWVHQFGNYNPKGFRSYWIPRGWYTSARAIEDPRLKAYADTVDAMLDYISEEGSRDAEVRETNLRIYDRYNRWTIRWQPHVYDLEIYNDTAIYNRRTGSGVSVASAQSMMRTTAFSGGTEAMDETAQGPWLDLVTRMGFGYLMASVRFLDESQYDRYRLEGESGASVRMALVRPRPVRAGR
jgi:hypothetical protein